MKAKTLFYCTECGNETPKWSGQCPACRAWNTLVERPAEPKKRSAAAASVAGGGLRGTGNRPRPMREVETTHELRFETGMNELDRVLGGGAVKGSLVLVGGAPGIGKSTLMLQICDNLCRLGLTVELCSAVGGDAYGDMLRGACAAAGIGTRHLAVFPAQNTSAYISIMDSEGDMLVAMSDMHILKEALTPSYVEGLLPVLNGADVCVADANLSAGALETLATRCTVPLMLDPVSTAWARNAAPLAGYFHTLKPNLMEMEVLSGMRITNERELDAACGMLLEKGVYQVFVSLGREGLYFRRQGCGALRKKSRPFPMKNATGAGDATMAGIVYAWVNGLSPGDTLDFALGAGLAAIDSADTINPAMSPALVAKLVKEYVL